MIRDPKEAVVEVQPLIENDQDSFKIKMKVVQKVIKMGVWDQGNKSSNA